MSDQGCRIRRFAFIAGTAILSGLPLPAFAGPGHDHGPVQKAIVIAPRSELRIANQEAVLTYQNEALIMFLHRYSDGEPTTGAEIEATVNFISNPMTEIAPGVYRAEAELTAGRNDIELSYTIGDQSGTAETAITLPSLADSVRRVSTGPLQAVSIPSYALITVAVGLHLSISLLFTRRLRNRRSPDLSA